jgi:hypothetical protein
MHALMSHTCTRHGPRTARARAAAAALALACAVGASAADGWQEYFDAAHGYRVRHPDEWVRDAPSPDTVRLWSRPDYHLFVVPDSGGLRRGIFTVTIRAWQRPAGATLETFPARVALLESAERVASRHLAVGGLPARQDHLVNAGPFAGLVATYVLHGDAVFSLVLDYSAAPDPDQALERYQRLVASFTLVR